MFDQTITSSTGGTAHLAVLREQLLRDQLVTAKVMHAIASTVRTDADVLPSRRLDSLVAAAAWTDAALVLLDGALPRWKLRRLVYDDGEWHCALSQRRELPDWLDEAVESRHANRAVALMLAAIEALRQDPPVGCSGRGAVPRVRPVREGLICCENFA
ncbi:hypothetical protein [Bradyrhizobium sp. 2TAF24]|uniref:hypothetical protein n=1 Tax=Bradyrhizobium sp. 2TAF24 TaxID=3233011 RepID=UPI003F90A1D1